jgi:site-specific DNA-adenine methylase
MVFPGGKGLIYQKLINLMPPHDVYIETHLGGGSVLRHKRLSRRNIGIDIDPEVIGKWSSVDLTGIELVLGDAVSFIKGYPFTGSELVYCDPPYLQASRRSMRRYYRYEYSEQQHQELLEVIKLLPCLVMISGYETELYQEVLKDWHSFSFESVTWHGTATEWVWMNYSAPVALHDYRYLGNNFRERERIKKMSKNWVSRLLIMPVLERQALLYAIESVKVDQGK